MPWCENEDKDVLEVLIPCIDLAGRLVHNAFDNLWKSTNLSTMAFMYLLTFQRPLDASFWRQSNVTTDSEDGRV